jgi:hypothetical protein
MAGGLFFLGQAVASASDQVADASNSTDQANASTEGGGGGANLNGSEAEAKNVDVTKVDSTVTGGNGGVNEAAVNTGVLSGPPNVVYSTSTFQPGHDEHEKQFSTVTFNSGDVTLTQNANGGSVNGSGNIAVADTGGSQTATASNTVNQSNSSEGDEHHGREHHDGDEHHGPATTLSEGGDEHHGDGNANFNESDADATNIHKIDVDSTVTGGNGGDNYAEINTGIIGNTFYCPEHSTCTFNFHTGNVNLVQNANGGSVNGSGNIGIGAPVPGACQCPKPVAKSDCPKSAAPAAEVRSAMKPAARTALSSAQPSGQLAFTGSDVSLPLTVGLLALVAGLGLTVLGRRRETQTV